jgi:transglutaminase-like putative cysteine protease
MSFSRLHKLVTYLLAGIGLVALSLGTELDESVVALIYVGYLGSWFAEGPMLRRPSYTTAWTVAVVAFLVLQLARGVLDEPTLAMAMEFAAFLQVSRLFNRRGAADYQQVAVLAFLHLIAATVLSTSLAYAAIFLGFVVATPWMLALSHLRREIEGNYPVATEDRERAESAVGRVLASRRVVGPRFLAGTAALAIPLFLMTLSIFVVIPRVGKGFLTFDRERGQRVAGFGNQIELGDFGVIRDDPTVVLRITLDPATRERPPLLAMYLRGTSFDRYDGRRWTRSPSRARTLARVESDFYPLRRLPDPDRDLRLRIVLDHLDEPVVFVPSGTIALSIPPRIEDSARVARDVTHAAGLDVRYEDPDSLGLMYTAWVSSDPAERDILPLSPERRQMYLQLPPSDGRIEALARQIVGDAATDLDKASRLESHLRTSYTYTLEQPDVGSTSPLEAFLFEQKRGHCEYFSSAMTIMLRTLGIRARNVTGFVGGRYNPFGDYYAVRQGDAHSWVEAYIPDRGWVTFEPTPPARGELGPQEGPWADMRALIDALHTRWMTHVVGYDLRVQAGGLRKAWQWWVTRRNASDEAEAVATDVGGRWLSLRASAFVLLGGAVCVLLAWLAFRMRRASDATARQVPEHVAQAVRLYADLEHAMRKRGRARPVSATPFEHARRLAEDGFAASTEVEAITRGYVECRYGERVLSPHEIGQLRRDLERVRTAAP